MSSRAATPAEVEVLVFTRAAEPGRVKSRLVPALGGEGAARLQHRLLLRTLRTAVAAGVGPVSLACAPDRAAPYFGQWAARHRRRSQGAGDLGERMQHAFEGALRRHGAAILVGSDCPALKPSDLRAAASALRGGAAAVIAPAEDGGYPLIGLARSSPRLFRGIAWGSPRVMAQTRRRLAALRWRWHELRTLWDVDRPEDYARLLRSGLLER
jgi:rSAM/selenodomain-associated transferase 1